MPASYPSSVKAFATNVDGVDDVTAADVNDLQLETTALETQALTVGTWTPTFTGFSVDPAGGLYRYHLTGKVCTIWVEMPAGTSNAAGLTMTLPFTAVTAAGMYWRALAGVVMDNSVSNTEHPGRVFIGSGSNIATCYRTLDSTLGWTAGGTKRISFTLTYEIA